MYASECATSCIFLLHIRRRRLDEDFSFALRCALKYESENQSKLLSLRVVVKIAFPQCQLSLLF